jgi:uncharacterized protein YciI
MRLLAILVPLLVLPACAAAGRADAATYSWVWILTGPQDAAVQGEARQQAFAGHFGNMGRLAEEGALLVAGPMAEPRASLDHRGIFILDVADGAAAHAVAATDPAAIAGIFRLEVEPFLTAAPIRELPARHQAFVAASGVADPPMDFHCRGYVMVTGTPARAAEAALAGAPEVLLAGRFPARDAAHFWLDFTDADAARAFLAARAGAVDWLLMPWFGSEEIGLLAGSAR